MTYTKKYRITSKFRFTMFMVIVLLCIVAIFNSLLGFYSASSLTNIQYKEIEVSTGDTLWSIASTHMPDNKDPRESVYELGKINNISDSHLEAGQTILVPIYEE